MNGKTVLITGCSTGIGHNIAETLTETGYTVVATARNPDTIQNINAKLKLRLDVTDNQSVQKAVSTVIQELGKIDILINNSGIAVYGAIEEVPDDLFQKMFDVNVFGVIRMTKACVSYMRERKSGMIINISSNAGKISMPFNGSYSATKFALEAINDALRVELSTFGIKVVSINPGTIKTKLNDTGYSVSGPILNNEASVYYPMYRKFFEIAENSKKFGPELVSQAVKKAIESPQPETRYSGAPSMLEALLKLGENERDIQFKRAYDITEETEKD
jgi:NADP-dependent 3-hydroxy acid dehydrogenase YdfG